MPELGFRICGAQAMRDRLSPGIGLRLEIAGRESLSVESILLHVQIQIETSRRRYTAEEKSRLGDLFGEPERWRESLRPLAWANLTTNVPAFIGSVCVEIALPCSFDFQIGVTKYLHALEGAAVPLSALFSGTVFYRSEGWLQAAPIPWHAEARFDLLPEVWREAMDVHYPNTAWLALRRDVFERLGEYKKRHGFATFDDAIEQMTLNAMEAQV